jgi:hypothetical protein
MNDERRIHYWKYRSGWIWLFRSRARKPFWTIVHTDFSKIPVFVGEFKSLESARDAAEQRIDISIEELMKGDQ